MTDFPPRRAARRSRPAAPFVPSRSTSSATPARPTSTKSWPAGSRSESFQKASRIARFTLLRSTAPPTLRPTETPRRTSSPPSSSLAREGVEDEVAVGLRASVAVGAVEVTTAGEAATLAPLAALAPRLASRRPISDGEALAALAAAAADDRPAVPRPHPGTESVRASALSLLWLPGSLHLGRPPLRPGAAKGRRSISAPATLRHRRSRATLWRDLRSRVSRPPSGLGRRPMIARGPARALCSQPADAAPSAACTDRPTQELSAIWNGVREDLRGTLPPSAFQNWLEPLRAVGVQGTPPLCIGAGAGPRLVPAPLRQSPPPRRCAGALPSSPRSPSPTRPPEGSTLRDARASASAIPAGLRRGLDFDRFVIGSGNRFAHSAALAVAESPGESYNPLFLYGAPGLGKTHLLVSIANYLRRQRPEMPVVYTTAERFTSEFVTSLRGDGRRHRPALQGALPRGRRPADRRRPVPRGQAARPRTSSSTPSTSSTRPAARSCSPAIARPRPWSGSASGCATASPGA